MWSRTCAGASIEAGWNHQLAPVGLTCLRHAARGRDLLSDHALGCECPNGGRPRDRPRLRATQGDPGEWLEHSPLLTTLVLVLASGWLYDAFKAGNPLIAMSGLNTYNFEFPLLGALLHWRPRGFISSFAKAMPGVSGVLLQFPVYGGIAYMLTKVKAADGSTLSDAIAHGFVRLAHGTGAFSVLVGIYSAVLGFFIPSADGKGVIEAPDVMKAANEVGAHLGWTVMVYNIAETLPNFINPFWMLLLLGVLGLKFRDLIGYTAVRFMIHLPIMLVLAAVLMTTFPYHPPIVP